jgi:hypothetical protein
MKKFLVFGGAIAIGFSLLLGFLLLSNSNKER